MPKKKEPTEAATKETKTTVSKTGKAAAPSAKTAKSESAAPKTAKPTSKAQKSPSASSASATAKATKPATKTPAKVEKPAAEKPADGPNPIITVIVAKFDVGHGNNLYIRGDGHSLSWESGTLMENAGGDTWQWTTTEAREGVLGFKLLINDQIWCVGDNMNAPFGETTTFYPAF